MSAGVTGGDVLAFCERSDDTERGLNTELVVKTGDNVVNLIAWNDTRPSDEQLASAMSILLA